MNKESEMSEQQNTQTTKIANPLPWLRFVSSLIFYVILIIILFWGGCQLVKNTKASENSRALKELIEAIKDNTKHVTTKRLSKENTKVEHEFKDSSSSYNRKPFWLSSIDSTKTTIESSKEEDIPECYTILKDDFENALKAVALVSRQEAAEDYHKSLSIIVSLIALFGIGFPIIIALIQSRLNERDLDKIEKTANKTDEAVNNLKKIQDNANKATEIALTAANDATKAMTDTKEAIMQAKKASQAATEAITQSNNASTNAQTTLAKTSEIQKNINEIEYGFHNEMMGITTCLRDFCLNIKDPCLIILINGQGIYHCIKRYFVNQNSDKLEEIITTCELYLNHLNSDIKTKDDNFKNHWKESIDHLRICSQQISDALLSFNEILINKIEEEKMKMEIDNKAINDLKKLEERINQLHFGLNEFINIK